MNVIMNTSDVAVNLHKLGSDSTTVANQAKVISGHVAEKLANLHTKLEQLEELTTALKDLNLHKPHEAENSSNPTQQSLKSKNSTKPNSQEPPTTKHNPYTNNSAKPGSITKPSQQLPNPKNSAKPDSIIELNQLSPNDYKTIKETLRLKITKAIEDAAETFNSLVGNLNDPKLAESCDKIAGITNEALSSIATSNSLGECKKVAAKSKQMISQVFSEHVGDSGIVGGNTSIDDQMMGIVDYLEQSGPSEIGGKVTVLMLALFIADSRVESATTNNISAAMNSADAAVNALNAALSSISSLQALITPPYQYNGTDNIINHSLAPGTPGPNGNLIPNTINNFDDMFFIGMIKPGQPGYDPKVSNAIAPIMNYFFNNLGSLPTSVATALTSLKQALANGIPQHGRAALTKDFQICFDYVGQTLSQSLYQVSKSDAQLPDVATNSSGYVLDNSTLKSIEDVLNKAVSDGTATSNDLSLQQQSGEQAYSQSLQQAKSIDNFIQANAQAIWGAG